MCFLIKYLSVGHAWFWFTNSVDLTLSRIIFAPANEWAQEFLVFDPDAEAHFLHNFTISDAGTWKYVHHRVLPPAALPEDLPADIAVAFEVLKRDESLLRGGLLAGISLTLPRLHQVMASIQCPKPSKGTGKNGRIKKIDLVTALVKHLWPDETNEFIKETVNKVMGSGLPEDVDLSVLSMVSELDTANQESFSKMKDQARKKLDTVLYGKGRLSGIRDAKKHDDCGGDAKAAESKVDAQAAKRAKKAEENHLAHEKSEKLRQWNLTPPQLKLLLPGAGAITGQFWMRWHQLQHWWKVTYPSSTLSNLIRFVFFC